MKNLFTVLATLLLTVSIYAQVGINNENPEASAALDVTSTSAGFLMPRMSNTDRKGIDSPAAGLQVYVTDFNGGTIMMYDGSNWNVFLKTFIDDTAPSIISGVTGINLVENTGEGQTIYTITATDNVGVDSYSIAGRDATLLSVDSSSGVVSLIADPDYETNPNYSFTVSAVDAAGNTSAAITVTFLITEEVQAPSIGGYYQGGVVFYIFQNGDTGYVEGETHGLICAVKDQGSNIKWYSTYNNSVEGLGGSIGAGSSNTSRILTSNGAGFAAGAARDYQGGGYTDWFLPSRTELIKMGEEKNNINSTASTNGGTNLSGNYNYWSSSEWSNIRYYAWIRNLSTNTENKQYKNNTASVRAVRAF